MTSASRLRTRNFHLRQYFGVARFDVWADDKCYGSFASPHEADACIRRLLGVTSEEAVALDAHIEHQNGRAPEVSAGEN